MQILLCPPPKFVFKWLVRTKVLDFWHKRLSNESKDKPSLCFLQPEYLPLGAGLHPLWLSCEGSRTANRAAILQAQIISGRYRDDYLSSKWDGGSACCQFHIMASTLVTPPTTSQVQCTCPALKDALEATLFRSIRSLTDTPLLIPPITSAFPFSRPPPPTTGHSSS